MALTVVDNGTFDNDPSAEKIRDAWGKLNVMMAEVYGKVPLALSGQTGLILRVNAGETAFELVSASGMGDLLAANDLSDLDSASQGRLNLGLDSASTQPSSAFATSAQGVLADSALQSVVAGTGITVDITDPQNPVVANTETNDYVDGATFAPGTGILTLDLLGGGTVTVNLSAYTVLKIDGYQVIKGSGKTNYTTIEVTDKITGWASDTRYVSGVVNAIPYATSGNTDYAIDSLI